jgi:hypothetical protein
MVTLTPAGTVIVSILKAKFLATRFMVTGVAIGVDVGVGAGVGVCVGVGSEMGVGVDVCVGVGGEMGVGAEMCVGVDVCVGVGGGVNFIGADAHAASANTVTVVSAMKRYLVFLRIVPFISVLLFYIRHRMDIPIP